MFSRQKNTGVKSFLLSVLEASRHENLRWKYNPMWHAPCAKSHITGDTGCTNSDLLCAHCGDALAHPIKCIPEWLD